MIGVGDTLPRVTLLDDEGRMVDTSSFLGAPLVLYFYPKDDTPGCTSEASQFRDIYRAFERKGAKIVGVSRDPVLSHQKFKAKYKIPFALLSDTESELCNACGVLVEKNMYGKKRIGVARATFLFDASGKVVALWPKVSVDGHAEEVLAAIS